MRTGKPEVGPYRRIDVMPETRTRWTDPSVGSVWSARSAAAIRARTVMRGSHYVIRGGFFPLAEAGLPPMSAMYFRTGHAAAANVAPSLEAGIPFHDADAEDGCRYSQAFPLQTGSPGCAMKTGAIAWLTRWYGTNTSLSAAGRPTHEDNRPIAPGDVLSIKDVLSIEEVDRAARLLLGPESTRVAHCWRCERHQRVMKGNSRRSEIGRASCRERV
jgi:hypothetical protein